MEIALQALPLLEILQPAAETIHIWHIEVKRFMNASQSGPFLAFWGPKQDVVWGAQFNGL
jgi:hypothetical protein